MLRFALALCLFALTRTAWARNCPCQGPSLCDRVVYNQKEVHGYVLKSDHTLWNTFNWTKLTTISLVDFWDDKLLCLAHENDVRVLTRERFVLEHVQNSSYVNAWIQAKISAAQENFVDGINLFVDDPVAKGDPLASELTQFVQLVTQTFHAQLPGSVVVFNVPFSPYNEKKNGVDGKNYDFLGLSQAADQLFIMDYDQRKQSFDDRCLAGASSNYYYTMGGILAYQNLSLKMDKLVLGVPFFAHDYQCVEYSENLRCYIPEHEYRGSKCSSLVATVVPFNQLNQYKDLGSKQFWDEHSSTVLFNYISMPYGYLRQLWFDRDDTIELKYRFAAESGLRGVGMWCLNYMANSSWAYIPDNRNRPLL